MSRGERTIKVKFDGEQSGLDRAAKASTKDINEVDKAVAKYSETVRRLERDIRRTGDASLFKDLNKNRRLLDQFKQLGSDAGTGFGVSLIGKAGPLLARLPLSPQVIGAAAAIGVAMSPLIAAGVAAGVLGGVGAGGVVGGAVLVKDDPRVKAAFKELATEAGAQLRQSAEPFVPAIASAVDKAKAKIRELKPEFDQILGTSASFIDPATVGALEGIANVVRGAAQSIGAAKPVITAFGEAFAQTGETVGKFIQQLSDDGPAAADAVRVIADTINITLGSTFKTIELLTEAWGKLRLGWAGLTGDTATIAQYTSDTIAAGVAQKGAADASNASANALVNNTIAMQRYRQEADGTAKSVKGQADALRDLYAASRLVHDQQLSLAEAQLALKSATDQAKTAADGHKKVSNDEQAALLGLARQTNTTTGALEKSGATTAELTRHSNDTTKSFIALAQKMGYTKDQATDLAKRYLAVPENVTTKVDAPGLAKSKNDASAFLQYANDLNGMRIRVSFETSGFVAPEGAKAFKRWGGVTGAGTTMAANGLLRDASIFSPVSRGARYGFAEASTGGEAFIPKRGDLKRSLAIWETVGRDWLGVLPKKHGSSNPPAGQAAGAAVAITNKIDLDGKPFKEFTVYTSQEEIDRADWKRGKR